MTFKRLHSVGEILVWDYKNYIVRRVAVVDRVQHVNLEKGSVEEILIAKGARKNA